MPPSRRLACWVSEKKSQKLNWTEFQEVCSQHGFELFKLDLSRSLESQGPFCVLFHKLTDIIAGSIQRDIKSIETITAIENYLSQNPSTIVIDPLANVKVLLDRYKSYSIIRSTNLHEFGVFTPNFCEFRYNDITSMKAELKKANVTYPLICKPLMGHGSRQAHYMSIIFDEKSLIDCRIPCVAQSFVPHNAVLYKIFIVGDKYCCVKRPSLKNYYAGQSKTINFDSGDVSKANSQSSLCVLDPDDEVEHHVEPDDRILRVISSTIRKAFGMDLLGVDVVMENGTGKYAIIDVNSCPGYDGFPDFFPSLFELINEKVSSN